jgi:hypothetical protein
MLDGPTPAATTWRATGRSWQIPMANCKFPKSVVRICLEFAKTRAARKPFRNLYDDNISKSFNKLRSDYPASFREDRKPIPIFRWPIERARQTLPHQVRNDFSSRALLHNGQMLGRRKYIVIDVERGSHASDVIYI